MTVNAPPTVVAPPTFRSSPIARLFSNLEFAANLAEPVNVEIPVIVAAAPTLRSSPISNAFSNLESAANLAPPVTVNAAPTVAAAPTFKSLLNVEPVATIISDADADKNVVNPAVTFNSSAFALPSFVDEPVPTL